MNPSPYSNSGIGSGLGAGTYKQPSGSGIPTNPGTKVPAFNSFAVPKYGSGSGITGGIGQLNSYSANND